MTEAGLSPAAEAFRNFDADAQSGLVYPLPLDPDEERRRGTSRANSVRFDESANNHYGSAARQSVELLPLRTGSGLGGHPLSERSLSHRSDGKGSLSGVPMRANSFGLEQSRLLGSITSPPKAAGNPPPAFYVLGPVPALIRCWLTETFSNDSLLYAAACSGSYASCISTSLVRRCGLDNEAFEENGVQKIRLPVYLTEATIHQSSSRSASPAPQVPTLTAKFMVVEAPTEEKMVQVVIGSDILRAHNADILFSQEKLMISDEDRNRLAIPLVRPESDITYKALLTITESRQAQKSSPALTNGNSSAGVIGRPRAGTSTETVPGTSDNLAVAVSEIEDQQRNDHGGGESSEASSTEPGTMSVQEDARSVVESEMFPTPTPSSRSNSGVWGNSWRASPTAQGESGKTASGYSRAGSTRTMKVLRPGKSMAASSRSTSGSTPTGTENVPNGSLARRSTRNNAENSKVNAKPVDSSSHPTKSNPIGQASAFPWLNTGAS